MTVRFVRVAFAALACSFGASAFGQAAPQLLPDQTSLVAGGGSTATFTAGGTCPVSGKTVTDAYGDGCLATEIKLTAPKYVAVDTDGTVYFSDSTNKLVRRIDGVTGVITTVAGGAASNPASGAACGTRTSTDFQGDGCLATSVKLGSPTGVAISPLTGDLYFADITNYTVRKISKTTGVVTNVAGNVANTAAKFGYVVGIPGSPVDAATASTIDAPYGIRFDKNGNLFISEEFKEAIFVVNTTAATTTVTGVSIPAGAIMKIAGTRTGGVECINGTSGTTGCNFGKWADNAQATKSLMDNPYDVTPDNLGNVFFPNQFNAAVAKIDNNGVITTWAGTQGSGTITNKRGVGNTVNIGSNWDVAADQDGNIYTGDSVRGWIWRVDAANQGIYVLAGAATSVCSGATTSYGDGCPASQTKFTAGGAATATFINTVTMQGLFVDAAGTLYVVDTSAGVIHKLTTNTNFGTVLAGINPTQTLNIHFGAGDVAAASGYTLTSGANNFTLGSPTCTLNSDTTTDCLLPVTANPTAGGAFSGNLRVTTALGKTANFTLSGTLELHQVNSSTALQVSPAGTNPATPVTLTATVTAAGGASAPVTGTVTFFSGSTQLGQPQTLVNGTATLSQLFPLGTAQVTAVYSGNLYLFASTSTAATVVSTNPDVVFTPTAGTTFTVKQGGTATPAFTLSSAGLYTGTVQFACSGLPALASCSFSPTSLTMASGGSYTVTVAVLTGEKTTAMVESLNRTGVVLCVLPGAALLLLGFARRKRMPVRLLLLVVSLSGFAVLSGCGSGDKGSAGTPVGTYNVTITATGTPSVTAPTVNLTKSTQITLVVTK